MNLTRKLTLTSALIVAMSIAAPAFAEITGSLTSKELVSMNQTAKTSGNQLVPSIENSDGKYDRLNFSKTKNYDFEKDKKIPSYLGLRLTKTKRINVLPDQKVRFKVTADSLIANINILLSHTNGRAFFHENFPKSFRFYNSFYVTGDNVASILDQLVEPWRIDHNAHATTHINNIVEFTASN